MIKIILSACIYLFLILGGIIPFVIGETIIDGQKDTICNEWGYCETKIDLTKYMLSNQITAVKSVNLKEYLPKIEGIESINYRFDKDTLVIYGYVVKNTYWEMSLSNTSYKIDPYWNISYSCKQRINITTTTGINRLDSINISLDTTNQTCFKQASGNDTRIVVDVAGTFEEKYTFNTSEFNYSKTIIWFNVSSAISQNGFNDSYYVYSGNSNITVNPFSNGRAVFKYFYDKATAWGTLQGGVTQTEEALYRNVSIYYTSDDGLANLTMAIPNTTGQFYFRYNWRDLGKKTNQGYNTFDDSGTNNQLVYRVNSTGNVSIERLSNAVWLGWAGNVTHPSNEIVTMILQYQQDGADKQAYTLQLRNKTEYYITNETMGATTGTGISRIRIGTFVSGTKANSGGEYDIYFLFWSPYIDAKATIGAFEFPDATAPYYTTNQTQYNNKGSDSFRYSFLNISWFDSDSMGTVLVEHNLTGSKTNYTMGSTFGGGKYNYTFNVTTFNSTYCWVSFANDSTGNVNKTGSECFTPLYFVTTYINTTDLPSNLPLRSVCENNETLVHNATINGEYYEVKEVCNWGCDTVLNICKPNTLYQWLILVGVGLFIIWVIRFLRLR